MATPSNKKQSSNTKAFHGNNNARHSNIARPSSSASGSKAMKHQSNRSTSVNSNAVDINQGLLDKEQELMRRNAELEKRAAALDAEAAEILNRQDEIFLEEDQIDNFSNEDVNLDEFIEAAFEKDQKSSKKTASKITKSGRTQKTTKIAVKSGNKPKRQQNELVNDLVDNDIDEITLAQRIMELEDEIEEGKKKIDLRHDDILPAEASEMGTEAVVRFLKAKVRVLQEELERLMVECNKKDERVSRAESKAKQATDEQIKTQRLNQTLQTQLDKYKKMIEDSKKKSETLEAQLTTLRKDLESSQRVQKQAKATHGAVEVRLNRALEEIDKLKISLVKAQTESKDSKVNERKRIEQLTAENKRLEKQKNTLTVGFKKQLKLIDILKKQKMHIEAAKLLSFTEEEFVRALDWGS